jgi:hypothetical protein
MVADRQKGSDFTVKIRTDDDSAMLTVKVVEFNSEGLPMDQGLTAETGYIVD